MSLTPTRLTDAAPGWTAPEYSCVDPWIRYNSRLLLLKRDHFGLYDGTGAFLEDLPIGASERPRWSSSTPYPIYIRGNQIGDGHRLLHTFLEYVAFDGNGRPGLDDGGEADTSEDGDHRVLCGTRPDGKKEIFVYRISSGEKLKLFTAPDFNNLLITPSNRVLLDGMWLYDGNPLPIRKVFGTDSHKAVARFRGREILITSNSNESPQTLPDNNAIVMVDIETGHQTCVLALGWNQTDPGVQLAVHISAPKGETDFCIVSTYAPRDPNRKDGYWNAILKVWLDGRGAEVLCYHNSNTSSPDEIKKYTAEPKCAVSEDGTKAVYGTNDGNPDGPVNTYLIELTPATLPPAPIPPAVEPAPIPAPNPDGLDDAPTWAKERRRKGLIETILGWFKRK